MRISTNLVKDNSRKNKNYSDRINMESRTPSIPTEPIRIGDFIITPEAYAGDIERENLRREEFENARKKIYTLQAKKKHIQSKLKKINYTKKNDYKLAAELNYKLEITEWKIDKIKKECNFDHIESFGEKKPSEGVFGKLKDKLQLLKERLAEKTKKVRKKIKKFINKHQKTIRNIIVAVTVGVLSHVMDTIFGKKVDA